MLILAGIISSLFVGSIMLGSDFTSGPDDDDQNDDLELYATEGDEEAGFFDLGEFIELANGDPTEIDPMDKAYDIDDIHYESGTIHGLQAFGDLLGTDADDIMVGTDGRDFLYGLNGQDQIGGGDGDDVIWGQVGDDELHGQIGNDRLYGGMGADHLYGEDGEDDLYGADGDDALYGYQGDDNLDGGLGNDSLEGGQGKDFLDGALGDDQLSGGYGDDYLKGGLGQDVLMGGDGDDVLVGSVENADGIDEDGQDFLNGGDGNDTLVLGADDVATGGAGADKFMIGSWLADGPGQIMDFNAAEDEIILPFNHTGAMPQITLTHADGNPDFAVIALDGHVVANVTGAEGLTADDVKIARMDDTMPQIDQRPDMILPSRDFMPMRDI